MSYCKTKQYILTDDIRSCLLPDNPDKPENYSQNIVALAQVLSEYTADVTPYDKVEKALEAILTMVTKATLIRSELYRRGVNPDGR